MATNYFEVTAKSKSGKNIKAEMDEIMGRIHENDDLNGDIEDDFYPASTSNDIYRVEIESEFYHIEDALVDFLVEVTDEYPDLAFEIIQTFEGDQYYRHIFADGDHEEFQGEIMFPSNERLKYFD